MQRSISCEPGERETELAGRVTATSRRRAGVMLISGTYADAVSSAMTRKREEAARTNQPGAVGGQRYKMEEQVLVHFVNVWGGGGGG